MVLARKVSISLKFFLTRPWGDGYLGYLGYLEYLESFLGGGLWGDGYLGYLGYLEYLEIFFDKAVGRRVFGVFGVFGNFFDKALGRRVFGVKCGEKKACLKHNTRLFFLRCKML